MSAHEHGSSSVGPTRDGGGVDELLDRHVGVVSAYVRRRVADLDDAEEIIADVFVKAWRAAGARPVDADRERPWLLSIARNRVIDQYRRTNARGRMRQRLSRRAVDTAVPAPGLPDDGTLAQALQQLSDDDRELLRLVAWEQLPHAEIATVLGCATANVAVRLHRARARLRTLLSDLDDHQAVSSYDGEGSTR